MSLADEIDRERFEYTEEWTFREREIDSDWPLPDHIHQPIPASPQEPMRVR